jgi:hypothetical protein
MLDYVRQRPSPTILRLSYLSIRFLYILTKTCILFQLLSICLHNIECQAIDRTSLQSLFKLRNAQIIHQQQHQQRRALRIIYFREFDMNIKEDHLKADVKNLTESNGIDLKLHILNQSTFLSISHICSIIGNERRDIILVADLYTKEIDLISRSLKLPTIAITNRYQIVQGKLVRYSLVSIIVDLNIDIFHYACSCFFSTSHSLSLSLSLSLHSSTIHTCSN